MTIGSRLDLHIHSTVSDGTDPPIKILSLVKESGLDVFSLTDAETGERVYEGPVRRVENERGRFAVLDFSAVNTPGV